MVMEGQRAVLGRKIAAASRREAERTLSPVRVCEALILLLEETFQAKPSLPSIVARRVAPSQLMQDGENSCWFLFSIDMNDLIFSFDYSLTVAASNIAIGRNAVELEKCRPSVADRAIAALFAQKAARALAAAYDISVATPAFISAGWTLGELKISRGDEMVEWYEANDISFDNGLSFNLRCGVLLDGQGAGPTLGAAPEWSSRLSGIALDCPVFLKAMIGSVQMSIEELVSLKRGDSFMISGFDSDNVPLCSHGSVEPILSGKIGLHGASRAIRIHSPPEGLAEVFGANP